MIDTPMAEVELVASALMTAGFHALSDPLRVRVIELLRERELCVCDLCAALDIGQSKLSFHLKTLKAAKLVETRHQGRWIYYRLHPPQFAALEAYLSEYGRCRSMIPTRICQDQAYSSRQSD